MTKKLPPLSLTMDLGCVKVRKVLYFLPVGHPLKNAEADDDDVDEKS